MPAESFRCLNATDAATLAAYYQNTPGKHLQVTDGEDESLITFTGDGRVTAHEIKVVKNDLKQQRKKNRTRDRLLMKLKERKGSVTYEALMVVKK